MTAISSGPALSRLQSAGLIKVDRPPPELEYVFRHILTQEAVYGSLLRQDRRRLHLAVGEALEQAYPERLDELAPVLAGHYDEAGEVERALEYYARAGNRAARIYANVEAISHYTRALALAEAIEATAEARGERLLQLYLRRGRTLELSGQHAAAVANYREMEARGEALSSQPLVLAALLAQATLYATPTPAFDPAHAEDVCDRALELARELGDRAAAATILWNLSLLNYFTYHLERAVALGQQALALARDLGLQDLVAFTLNDLSRASFAIGDIAHAQLYHEEAARLWRELGNTPMLVETLANGSHMLRLTGQYESALSTAREAYQLAKTIGNSWGQSYSLVTPIMIQSQRAEYGAAVATAGECLRLGRAAGFIYAEMLVHALLGLIYADLGALDHGFECVGIALARAARTPAMDRRTAVAAMVMLQIRAGDLRAARESLGELRSEQTLFNPLDSGVTTLAAAMVALAQGEHEQAAELAEGLLANLRAANSQFNLADALYTVGRARLGLGQTEIGRELLEQAKAEAIALSERRLLWQILLSLADLAETSSTPEGQARARELREQAREVVEFIAAHAGSEELRACFLRMPPVATLLSGLEPSRKE